jgi:polar amino acid transport system substrate-binding protein
MLFKPQKGPRLLVILLLVFSPVWAANPPVEKLKICLMDTELFPLWRAPGKEELQDPGLNIELMNIILANANLQADWVRAPFLRCLALLQSGEVDIINAASYQAPREQYGRYPFTDGALDPGKRLKFDTYHAFVNTSSNASWDGNEFSQLGSLPIAIEIGASIKTSLEKLKLPVIELSTAEQAFQMLKRNRVSVVVTNQNNGNKYLDKSIKQLRLAVQTKAYYLMISHQFYARHTELSEKIWAESQALQQNEYSKLLYKYDTMPPWSESQN